MKLIDEQDRSVLSEGRSQQMGFAFCKPVDNETVETAHPISPCKDYCSDVVWTEHVGKHVSCCGLSYDKKGIFDGKVSFLAFKICDSFSFACRKHGNSYPHLDADRKRLRDNYQHVEFLLNDIEKEMGIEPLTKIYLTDQDAYVSQMSYFWSQYPYLTSLYCLLLRGAQFYDGTTSIQEFLKSLRNPGKMDAYHWNSAAPRLAYLMKVGAANVPVQHMDDKQNGAIFHGQGIIGFPDLAPLVAANSAA